MVNSKRCSIIGRITDEGYASTSSFSMDPQNHHRLVSGSNREEGQPLTPDDNEDDDRIVYQKHRKQPDKRHANRYHYHHHNHHRHHSQHHNNFDSLDIAGRFLTPLPRTISRYFWLTFVLLFVCSSLVVTLLYQNNSESSIHSYPSRSSLPKTIYSEVELNKGTVWHLNIHEIRRNRLKRSVVPKTNHTTQTHSKTRVFGLARKCGEQCTFQLRSDNLNHHSGILNHENRLKITFERWKQLAKPTSKNPDIIDGPIIPLIQYIDADDKVHARMSTVSPNCLYSARASGSNDHGIVNLCENHGGLFGTIVLPDGAYMIEPFKRNAFQEHIDQNDIEDDGNEKVQPRRKKRNINVDIRPHLIYRVPSINFHRNDKTDDRRQPARSKAELEFESYENRSDWIDVKQRYQRSRRSADSWDHFVEVLVVADQKMTAYHGPNLDNYILTLFSTVASIYRHDTLRASINIIVVKIIVNQPNSRSLIVTDRAQETLRHFCKWQQNYYEYDDDSPSHYDVAILLTRNDICRATNKCDTLGLAELGTMCDPRRSCALIEDNGLSAAFTIAHELGHIFNIPHDDELKCQRYMQLNKKNFHIMAPTLEYNTHPWSWSPCSSAMLSLFLDDNRAQTQCILDPPIVRTYYDKMFENPTPGVIYNESQQCQFVFGPNSEICPYMPKCRRLWCSTFYGYQMGCRTQHMPWADGTPCGSGQWCHRGQCRRIAPDQLSKRDGSWGEWKPWGDCSRTCGGGVQKALRDCDNPKPSNGGKYCVGRREQYRPCNIQDCPWDTPGFREVQCAEFNNQNVGIHGVPTGVQWIPKYNGVSSNERCKLYCRVKGTQAAYLLREKVLDGTPCDQHGDDICIDGTCHKAGCDHRLNSDMKRDQCGICGGDGTSCQTIKGVFNDRVSYGYNEVLRIPAGSANIDIQQHAYNHQKDDDTYLALRASNGEFLLNGHYQVTMYRLQISVQDTVLEYSGSDHTVERINGTGPIRSDLFLHVLSVGKLNPPDIHYRYMVPRDNVRQASRQSIQYFWRFSDYFTECSAQCQGQQDRLLHCIDAISNRQVHERHCTGKKPSPQRKMCNVDCFLKWVTKDVSGCTVSCGHGQKQQEAKCVKAYNNGHEDVISDNECIKHGFAPPPPRVPCYSDCSEAGRKWSYTDWTPCTASCGTSGISRRSAVCVDISNRQIDPRHCDMISKDLVIQECNRTPCPKWVYGFWSECSRSCDGGVQMRHAQCQTASGQDIEAHFCNVSEKIYKQKCNEHICTKWEFGNWSECSAACGIGIQTRLATCVDSQKRILDETQCDSKEKINQKRCERAGCPHWQASSWSSCSVSCMDGWKSRSVLCVDTSGKRLRDEVCLRHSPQKPPSHEMCNDGPCPFWRVSVWSGCNVTCGRGAQQRSVECVYRDQVVDDSFCPKNIKPAEHQVCTLIRCTRWIPTAWSECSVTCGRGTQSRKPACVEDVENGQQVEDWECTKHPKPRTERECDRPCYEKAQSSNPIYWATGSWTECSKTCGTGIQKRAVVCHDNYRQLPDEYCSFVEKKQNTRECNVRSCAEWSVSAWQPCAAICGIHHVQQRTVHCRPKNFSENEIGLPETDCDPTTKPEAVRNCNLPACPSASVESVLGNWIASEWGKCSVSCGGGWKTRRVECSTTACDIKAKPKEHERCNQQNCTQGGGWQITPWSSCSVSCGNGGVQQRRVWCQPDITSNIRLADSECAKYDAKPPTRRGCASLPCSILKSREEPTNVAVIPPALQQPFSVSAVKTNPMGKKTYHWQASKWSSCSASCGHGRKTRTVQCINIFTQAVVADEKCNKLTILSSVGKCRTFCPRWQKGKWQACSATCGNGVRKREVFCRLRRKRISDARCAHFPKPQETEVCKFPKCPSYSWKVTPWSTCSEPCKKSNQRRRIYCVSETFKIASAHMCKNQTEPIKVRPCKTDDCPYEWVPGPWGTCSRTCGHGNHFRRIDCKIRKSMQNQTNGSEPTVQSSLCFSLKKPIVSKECAINSCDDEYRWSVRPWEKCSKSCGQGTRERAVICLNLDGHKVSRTYCNASTKPSRRESCFLRNCLPSDCAEIKTQNTRTHSVDGNYTVLVAGFRVAVYCHLMNETIPKTYLNLNPETNFAEFYGKKLLQPLSCPNNGERNDSCECSNIGHVKYGLTRFYRVRVDLQNMKINGHDFTFAQTAYGTPVTYGSAGDCYSAAQCPQGRFSIDLRNTGLKIVDDLQWTNKGMQTSSKITRMQNNAYIRGQCGGYCGECSPEEFKGIIIEIDHKQRQRIGVG